MEPFPRGQGKEDEVRGVPVLHTHTPARKRRTRCIPGRRNRSGWMLSQTAPPAWPPTIPTRSSRSSWPSSASAARFPQPSALGGMLCPHVGALLMSCLRSGGAETARDRQQATADQLAAVSSPRPCTPSSQPPAPPPHGPSVPAFAPHSRSRWFRSDRALSGAQGRPKPAADAELAGTR